MEAEIADHVWTIGELCEPLPEPEPMMKKVDSATLRKVLGEVG
jgi:hypothetical protein